MDTTYDVRIYKTETYSGARVSSYRVRWKTAGQDWRRTFRNKAQADVFRGELLTAARKGEAFSKVSGEPLSWRRTSRGTSWYDFTCAYIDMKWNAASAKYRRAIAQALAAATPPMLMDSSDRPFDQVLRSGLVNWAYNSKHRGAAPEGVEDVLSWLSCNTRQVKDLADPALSRRLLTAATSRLDGTRAASTSVRRNRAVLLNTLDYAVELGLLEDNPIKTIKWRTPRTTPQVDRRVVVNPSQARALLEAVQVQKPSGPRLVAFFGVLYYSGLRPEEAVGLRRQDVALPELEWDDTSEAWTEPGEQWGELHLRAATPDAGKRWTDEGTGRDSRGLKHRAEGESRRVPCPPPLTRLLRQHLALITGEPAQYLFRGVQGRPLSTITYRRAWDRARRSALTEHEYQSLLARRPYDLRHACLSTWLNGGVAATQVAEWAGHSVEMLLRVYAKCLDGQDEIAKRRIAAALNDSSRDR
jgi:integrase